MIIFIGVLWLIGMWATVIYNSNNIYITVVNEIECHQIKSWQVLCLIALLYFIAWPVLIMLVIARKFKKERILIHLRFVSDNIELGFGD